MPHKLLLADDSVTIQRVIELTFADEDVTVTAVGDGKQAIERIEADPPDIVLADVGMPEKDGYEVADFVKRNPRFAHIPVLLLTGAFEPVDEDRAVRVGCDGVLAKPFEPQMVITRVRELLSANLATASRPTPRMMQPPPAMTTKHGRPGAGPTEPAPAVPAPPPAPPEPLLPPPPLPLSAGPTPIVPLPVVPPAERRQSGQPSAPVERDAGSRREVEVRLPGGEALLAPAVQAEVAEAATLADTPAPATTATRQQPERPSERVDAAERAAEEGTASLGEPAAEPREAADQTPEAEPAGEAVTAPPAESRLREAVEDRSPEEVAVESAIDAAIRIRRRPHVAVPEIGVPPKALVPEPADQAESPSPRLDDYFERLDAAFASRGQAREKRPAPVEKPAAPEARITPPVPEPAPPPMPEPEPAQPALSPEPPAAAGPSRPEPSPAPAAILPSAPAGVPSSTGLAQAFSALLDAERGEPGAGPVPPLFAPPAISPALREELVEQVARRVLERLSDRVVRETVTDLVSRVTERLVREEIERLKSTIK